MNKAYKAGLAVFGFNMFLVILLVITENSMDSFVSIGLFWLFSLFIQLIAGLILVFQRSRREWGKGILLGALLGLLIGFSVCSVALQ